MKDTVKRAFDWLEEHWEEHWVGWMIFWLFVNVVFQHLRIVALETP